MKFRRLITVSSVWACLCAPASAGTLVVDNDAADCPQADFNSIQAAVAAAQPGDKILVCPGTYMESVLVNESDLRIEAQGGAGEVVLQGTPSQEIGFHLLDTAGVLLQGFTVQGFRGSNIRVENGRGNTVRKNISTLLTGPMVGPRAPASIEVLNSSANVVEQNTAFSNCSRFCHGISIAGTGSTDNIVRNNEAFLNGFTGLQTNASGPRNALFGNRLHSNAVGIRNILGSHGNVIENNYVFANVVPSSTGVVGGIIVGASSRVTVRNNRSESNAAFGIRIQNASTDNLIEKNEVVQNDQDGIRLDSCTPAVPPVCTSVTANTVRLNLIRRNGRDGIRVDDQSVAGNLIERNVIRESGEHDAHDDSAGPATGGTANLWIENKCETENRPELCKNPF
jgi:parallel beta-helix repeat protein